jgi:integrase
MEGTIFRLHDPKNPKDVPKNTFGIPEKALGRWVAEISINGNKKRFYGDTQGEAKKKLKAHTLEVDTGSYIVKNDIKVSQWIGIWMETYKKASVSDVTFDNYTRYLDHTIEGLGNYSLQKVEVPYVQEFINKLISKKLSPRSIRDIITTTKQCFGKAVELKYIRSNPVLGTELPKVIKAIKSVLTSSEIESFKRVKVNHRMFPALLMQILMGLRKGEVLGLRQDDIDLVEKTVFIHQALAITKDKGVHIKPYPKNDSSIRTLPLHDEVVSVLQSYPFVSNEANIAFTTKLGTLMSPRNYLRDTTKIFGGKVNNHELRHTFITNMCNLGINPTITAQLAGHTDTRMVNNVYNHPDMKGLRDAIDKQK